jgi:hypothetical protein
MHPGLLAAPQLAPQLVEAPLGLVCTALLGAGAQLQAEAPEPTARLMARIADGAATRHGAVRARCNEVLAQAQRGWAAAAGADGDGSAAAAAAGGAGAGPPAGGATLGAVRAAAAAELGLVLVARDTPPERLRGLREGWVHWYVHSPVVHPESGAHFLFDERCGRAVALAESTERTESAEGATREGAEGKNQGSAGGPPRPALSLGN